MSPTIISNLLHYIAGACGVVALIIAFGAVPMHLTALARAKGEDLVVLKQLETDIALFAIMTGLFVILGLQ